LVGAGHISDEQLTATLEQQRSMDERRRIGELLIDSGLIDRETMRAYVREQIADSVAVTLSWLGGSWAFHADEEIAEDIPLDESVENLLMEGARRLEEWEVVQRRLGSIDAIVDFVPSGGTAELQLTADEWSMLTRIDGMSSVREIAGDAGYSEFAAARIIYGLLTAGVVTLIEDEEDEEVYELEEDLDLSAFTDLTDDVTVPTPEAQPSAEGAATPEGADAAAAELADLLGDLDLPATPAPAAAEVPDVTAPDIAAPGVPADDRTEEERPAAAASGATDAASGDRGVDRNQLLREFAALDEDWGTSAPTPSPTQRGGDDGGKGDVPPPVRRPAPPPPEDKGKRGLFGRRRKD
jgi:hypothetical protein